MIRVLAVGALVAALTAAASAGGAAPVVLSSCTIGQMRLTVGPPVSEKTEQHTATLMLTNIGSSTCALRGYPTVALFDASGHRIPFAYTREGDQMITAAPPARVLVPAEGRAVFALNKNASACLTNRRARTLRLTLPGSKQSAHVRLPTYPILDYCSSNDPGHFITLSPFEPRLPDAFCRSQGSCSSSITPACLSAQLKIAARHVGAALGTAGGYLAFRNISTTNCRLSGWPTVIAITAAGTAIPAERHRSTMFGPIAPIRGEPVVVIRPGERTEAVFTVGDNPTGGQTTCPVYHYLRVTAPGGTQSTLLSTWFKSLGWWLPACTHVWVSMVVPATDLYKG
jgi:hypothetical protein